MTAAAIAAYPATGVRSGERGAPIRVILHFVMQGRQAGGFLLPAAFAALLSGMNRARLDGMRITVDHPSRDELSLQSWAFYVTDNWHGQEGIAVILDRYTVSKRRSVSEKLRAESEWSRWGTAGFGGVMKLAKPPDVPDWIRARVRTKINESIVFVQQADATAGADAPPEPPGLDDR